MNQTSQIGGTNKIYPSAACGDGSSAAGEA
jgi:hypothetical protein